MSVTSLKRMALQIRASGCRRACGNEFDELELKSGIISSPSGNRRFSGPSIRFDQARCAASVSSEGMNPNFADVQWRMEYSAARLALAVNAKGHIGRRGSISLSISNSPNVANRALDSMADSQPAPQSRPSPFRLLGFTAPPARVVYMAGNHDDRDQLWAPWG